ncbi:MAG: hypothetical protein ACOYON_12215 [Fimbriimonas sp.]
MNIEVVIAAMRQEARSLATGGDQVERLPYLTRRLSTSASGNMVTAFNLDSAHADDAISGEIAFFAALGQPFEWKVFSFDSPPDLLDRLGAAGFRVGPKEAVMVYDLADGMGPFEENHVCEVHRIEDLNQLARFRQVAEAVFAKDYGPTTNELAEAIRTGQKGHDGYLGTIDGEPACVGRLYTDPASAFAGLYGGGTLAEFRGRGCYRAMVGARAHDAVIAGSRYLLVDALPTSQPILTRLGFVCAAETWPCSSPAIEGLEC